ncbi:Flavodoxin/ferredoxin--NADP reductase [Dirofilaria immitis]
MANFQIQKDIYENTNKERSKEESTSGKLDKIKLSNELNNISKKRVDEQFPIITSLFETSKVPLNIVEITKDSTLYSQKSSSNDLLNEDGIAPLPLSRIKCSKTIEAAAGSEKNGPFSAIKENVLKKQKDIVNFDEFSNVIPS